MGVASNGPSYVSVAKSVQSGEGIARCGLEGLNAEVVARFL